MMDHDELWHKRRREALFYLLCVILIVGSFFALLVTQCSTEKEVETGGGDTPAGQCSDGSKVGTTKRLVCEDGKPGEKVLVCKEAGKDLELVLNTCLGDVPPECRKVTFEENLKPIISANCASCHAGFVGYEAAVVGIDEWIRRISLSSQDPRRMPKIPKPELSGEEKNIFAKWREDGLIKDKGGDCQGKPAGNTTTLNYIETQILNDLSKVEQDDRVFIRYLVTAHKINEGQKAPVGKQALDKALNSLVEKSRDIVLTSSVDEKKTLYRFDLRSFELNRNDWALIENVDKINFDSNTDIGRTLKLLTATRKPWLHFDNFVSLVNTPVLYYSFLNVPKTQRELTAKLGVRYADDLFNLDATLIGNNDSPLTNQANRLISRHDSTDGYYCQTYDTGPLGNDRQKNLFEFPFLRETGSARVFKFVASETIFSLSNGLQGYALFSSDGNRQNAAPIDVVRDHQSVVSPAPVIENAISCHGCHAGGLNVARDEIGKHIFDHGDEFGSGDVQRAKSLYKGQTSLNALFKIDNKRYQDALAKLGIAPGVDPINKARDELLFNWNDVKLAAFTFLPLADLRTCINQSDAARTRIGQILSGNSVTFDAVVQTLPDIKKDCRLLVDPIN